jgi:hypothetical protein
MIIRGVRLRGTSAGKYEEGTPGTKAGRKDETLILYRQKERMTPAKNKGT